MPGTDPQPDDVVFVQWPTVAIENSAAEIKRLRAILQRLIDAFEGVSLDDLAFAEKLIGEAWTVNQIARISYAQAIRDARESIGGALEILGEVEAIPAHEAAEEGCDDGFSAADREIIEALQELTPDVRRLETDKV